MSTCKFQKWKFRNFHSLLTTTGSSVSAVSCGVGCLLQLPPTICPLDRVWGEECVEGVCAGSESRSDDSFAAMEDSRNSDGRRRSSTRRSAHASQADSGGSKTCEEYVGHVSLSEDQRLLHRAVGHLYSKIIQPRYEGGWADWFQEHCIKFDVKKNNSEHSLIYSELHREYETMVEAALLEFTAKEGIDNAQDLYRRILHAQDDPKFERTVNLLLAAADYKKFVSLMKRKHRSWIKENDKFAEKQARDGGVGLEFAKRYRDKAVEAAPESSSSIDEGPYAVDDEEHARDRRK
jgi:hypothetical protein